MKEYSTEKEIAEFLLKIMQKKNAYWCIRITVDKFKHLTGRSRLDTRFIWKVNTELECLTKNQCHLILGQDELLIMDSTMSKTRVPLLVALNGVLRRPRIEMEMPGEHDDLI